MKKISLILITALGMAALAVGAALTLPQAANAEGQSAAALSTVGSDSQETSFGDLATDAVRDAAGADVALAAAISFKAGTLGPGAVTADRVSSLLVNPEEVWAVSRLKGSQLSEALEHAVRSAPQPSSAFLQVSGLSFDYSAGGERGARVRNLRIGGSEVDKDADYLVAMPLSLAKGGSGYFTVFGRGDIERQGAAGLAATIATYANSRGRISYSGSGRINAE